MSKKPVTLRIFQILIICFSLLLLVFYAGELNFFKAQKLAVFIIIGVIAQMMPAVLPQGGKFSATFIIELALIKIFDGPAEALFTATISTLLGGLIYEFLDGKKIYLEKFNDILAETSQKIVVVSFAGAFYNFLGNNLMSFIIATLVYFNFELIFLALNKALGDGITLKKAFKTFIHTITINYLLLAPLAYVMAVIYINLSHDKPQMQDMQIFSMLLFFVPLLLVNYSVRLYMNIRKTYEETIKCLAATIEVRDSFMFGHSERVAEFATEIAGAIGYSEKKIRLLKYIVLLHDVGNLEVDEVLLQKKGPLTEREFEEIKKHAIRGAQIVSKIKFLETKVDIIKHHHEYYDGSGYPEGIKGENIPLGSRIIAIADAFDAMTSERPYRSARSAKIAFEEIKELAGKQFDPALVKVLGNLLRRRDLI